MTNRSPRDAEVRRFKEAVQEWAVRLRVRPVSVRLQPMTRKWASCSTAGRVTFSTSLLRESKRMQQYVIVHELLHLRVPNHGRLFKRYLTLYVPDWREIAPPRRARTRTS